MVISESMARKYFGESDPMGQVITGDSIFPFTVTGIMEDPPAYAHYHADFYVSLATVHVFDDPTQVLSSWSISQVHTYLLLPEDHSAAEVSTALQDMLGEHLDGETRSLAFTRTYSLQPLFDIHLYSNLEHELESNGDVSFIWMLMAIAVLILLIACMNFTNLAVVRSLIRAREIGVRKVVGATRRQIIVHSLGETSLFCGIAFIVALGVSAAVLPVFRAVSGYALSTPSLEPWSIVGGIGIVVFVSIAAGGYPAWALSPSQTGDRIQGRYAESRRDRPSQDPGYRPIRHRHHPHDLNRRRLPATRFHQRQASRIRKRTCRDLSLCRWHGQGTHL